MANLWWHMFGDCTRWKGQIEHEYEATVYNLAECRTMPTNIQWSFMIPRTRLEYDAMYMADARHPSGEKCEVISNADTGRYTSDHVYGSYSTRTSVMDHVASTPTHISI